MLKKTRLVTTYELGPVDLAKAIADYCKIETEFAEPIKFEQKEGRMHATVIVNEKMTT